MERREMLYGIQIAVTPMPTETPGEMGVRAACARQGTQK